MTILEASKLLSLPPSAFVLDDEYEPLNDYDEFFDTEEDAVGGLT